MPLPKPGRRESKDDFIDRCMGNETMNEDFPDPPQRRAVCERQWDDRDKESSSMRYEHVLAYVLNQPWAIQAEKLAAICQALVMRVVGQEIDQAEIEAMVAARPQAVNPTAGAAVAVLPLYGVIGHRAGTLNESSGGTSVERFTRMFRGTVNDPAVSSIVLDVDSPGGTVTGVAELADEVLRARSRKPVVAVANSLAASAAYWIAAQASEIIVIPSGEVGSIGVFAAHEDISKQLERRGVNITMVSAGRRKTEFSPFGPLSDEARGHLQEAVDHYYGLFTRAVARGRGVTVADARGERFGEGRVYRAAVAVERGMADRIGTLDQVVGELVAGQWSAPPRALTSEVDLFAVSDVRRRRLRILAPAPTFR